MEIKVSGADWLKDSLERIATALEAMAGKSGEVIADQKPAEDLPKKKAAAVKEVAEESAAEDKPQISEQELRKFCALAMKKGVKSSEIIKAVSGGEGKLSKIDPVLYPEIKDKVQEQLDQLEA